MAGKLNFSLVSPEREVFSGLVDQVDAPGVEGDFGVLADHAPFMTALRAMKPYTTRPGLCVIRRSRVIKAAQRRGHLSSGTAHERPHI